MRGRIAALLAVTLLIVGCGGGGATSATAPSDPHDPPPPPPSVSPTTWNVDSLGVPRFVSVDYIDLDRIRRISSFRSSVGHDYSDAFESCRSMKHYFLPRDSAAAVEARIYSPAAGTVEYTYPEWAGSQVGIRSAAYPAFVFVLFHVQLAAPLADGQTLSAGQPIGTHVGPQTYSDIAVRVTTPTGMKLVSWFDTVTDSIFAGYAARGLPSRDAIIYTKAQRDADPLTCNGEVFAAPGNLPQWVDLQ